MGVPSARLEGGLAAAAASTASSASMPPGRAHSRAQFSRVPAARCDPEGEKASAVTAGNEEAEFPGSKATPAGNGPASSSSAGVAASSVAGAVSATAAQSIRKTELPSAPTEAASSPGVVGCQATRPPTLPGAPAAPPSAAPPLKSAARATSSDPPRSSTVQTPTQPSSSAVASRRAPGAAPFAAGANARSVSGALWPLASARTALPPSRASSLTAPVPRP